MIESSFNINDEYQRVKIDIEKIHSKGGIENPMLVIPLIFSLNPNTRELVSKKFLLQAIEGKIKFNDSQNAISSLVRILNQVISFKDEYRADIEIQLTSYQIEKIEQSRKGDCKCNVELTIHYGKYRDIEMDNETFSFLFDFNRAMAQEMVFEIPQSIWASKILSGFGYKSFRFIEIPESSNIIPEEYSISINELESAQQYFIQGDYDKVVAHCRSAIDPIKKRLPELKSFVESESEFEWIKKVNQSTFDWIDKLVKETSNFSSKTHHAPSFGHFSRFEAEVITMITTAIVAYAGRMLNVKE